MTATHTSLLEQLSSNQTLQQAFSWLTKQARYQDNNDAWDYSRQWAKRMPLLQQALRDGSFRFRTVSEVQVNTPDGKHDWLEKRCAEDRLVSHALAQVLKPLLQQHIAPECTHLEGRGGVGQAVSDTREAVNRYPDGFVMKSDVKGYYAHIDLYTLQQQFVALVPDEPQLQRLLWDYLHRTVERGGNYRDVTQGIPLGSSLSPLLGALYLSPLDDALRGDDSLFYRRYQDDWVVISPKRHALKQQVKTVYGVLDTLKLTVAPDKTFIGKIEKSFDFLGFQFSPAELTVSQPALSRRDAKVTRLLEQGADNKRIGRTLAKWLAWVGGVGLPTGALGAEVVCPVVGNVGVGSSVSRSTCDVDGDGTVDLSFWVGSLAAGYLYVAVPNGIDGSLFSDSSSGPGGGWMLCSARTTGRVLRLSRCRMGRRCPMLNLNM